MALYKFATCGTKVWNQKLPPSGGFEPQLQGNPDYKTDQVSASRLSRRQIVIDF